MCDVFEARHVTHADKLAPCSPCFFCSKCFDILHLAGLDSLHIVYRRTRT